jgi:hypothetical protein
MYYSNTMTNFLSQYSTCIFSIRLVLDNAYGTIIFQAFPSKNLIEHERVKNYISLNMNVLKITNDVLCLQASFKLVLPNISSNMNVLKLYLIKHELVKIYKQCIMMNTLLIVVQTNTHKD